MQEPYSPVTDEYALWSCNDIDSTETEVIELIGSLVRATKPKICVEVGAHIGLSSYEIGIALKKNGRGHLHCFEVLPERARVAAQRIDGLPATLHLMADVDYDPANLGGPVDFLFVDGERDNRTESLRHWRPWLTVKSLVAVHDSLKWGEVHETVESAAAFQRVDIVTPRGLTLMKLVPARKLA
jgi:predicted O-methyltransferase YrrM